MKLYICSDIHEDYDQFRPPDGVEFILCAGDMTNRGFYELGHYVPTNQGLKDWLTRCLDIAPTFFVPGNHDLGIKDNPIVKGANNCWHKAAQIGTEMLYGCSLAPAFNAPSLATHWEHMTANPKMDEVYYTNFVPQTDILLSHAPPDGKTGNDRQAGQIGSPGLRTYIKEQEPSLVICGHVHHPEAQEEEINGTRVINVACRSEVIEL